MANQNSNYGFRPIQLQGAAYNGQGQNEYKIANGETQAIFQGDPVVLTAA